MSSQADVRSIDALKELRVAFALFGEDALAALGAVDMEVRRTLHWVTHDRRAYWQAQIKRRREAVTAAQAEVFRRKLAKTADYTPAMSEQKEILRRAEAALRDAEARATMVKKWEPVLQQAAFEYRGSTRRIKSLAGGDVPRAVALLERLIDALESYLSVAAPSGSTAPLPLETIADAFLAAEPDPVDPQKDADDDDDTVASDGPSDEAGATELPT